MYKTATVSLLAIVCFVGVAATADAARPTGAATLITPGTERTLTLPAAAAHSKVISLGSAIDPHSGSVVDGIAVIHYAKGHAKPEGKGNNGKGNNGGDAAPACYSFIAGGAKWLNAENYVVDPTNSEGLSTATIEALVAQGLETWDQEVATDVFGAQVIGVNDGIDFNSPDGVNEFLFANVSEPGVIGVTYVWGIFRGNPAQRSIVEWDMALDDTDFDWSAEATAVPGMMDFSNIFVHEAGHALGLGHAESCVEETMYPYADYGEDKKRTLEAGDIAGIQALYQ